MPALKFFFWRGEVREAASHDGCRWVVSEHVRRFLSLDSRQVRATLPGRSHGGGCSSFSDMGSSAMDHCDCSAYHYRRTG